MIRSFSSLKERSRTVLIGNYWTCFLALLISGIVGVCAEKILSPLSLIFSSFVLSFLLNTFLDLIVMILYSMLQAGLFFLSLNIARNEHCSLNDMFLAFRYESKKAALICLWLSLIKTVCILPVNITIYSLFAFGSIKFVGNKIAISILMTILTFLAAILITCALEVLIAFQFSQALFLYIDQQGYTACECMKKSRELMKGQKMRFLMLHLSFLGYIALVILSFGIGLIWVLPYINVTRANFYMDLTGNYHPY